DLVLRHHRPGCRLLPPVLRTETGSSRNPAAKEFHLGLTKAVLFSRRHLPGLHLLEKEAFVRFAGDEDRAGLAPLSDAGFGPQIEIPLEGLLAVAAHAFRLQQGLDFVRKGWRPGL